MCKIIEQMQKEADQKTVIRTVKEMIKAGLTTFEALKKSVLYSEKELASIAAN